MKLILLAALVLIPINLSADDYMLLPSLVNIIANPKSFEGKRVGVYGYLTSQGFALYLSKDHAKIRDIATAIQVENIDVNESALSEHCGEKYARIEGRVLRDMSLPPQADGEVVFFYIGELEKVVTFSDQWRSSTCWPMQ